MFNGLRTMVGGNARVTPTILPTARALGTAAAPAVTSPPRDLDTLVSIGGNIWVPLSAAIAMGFVQRPTSLTPFELERGAVTRTNA